MRFVLKTHLPHNYLEVYKQFDRNLFLALAPAFPKMELAQFDGSKKGDTIHIKFPQVKLEWISIITDDAISENEAFFIDEGLLLPPGLKFWKHLHKIERVNESQCIIVDDITFKGSNSLLSLLLYPILYLSFYPRKRAYRKYFK